MSQKKVEIAQAQPFCASSTWKCRYLMLKSSEDAAETRNGETARCSQGAAPPYMSGNRENNQPGEAGKECSVGFFPVRFWEGGD
jgi:hypothetical protein